MFHLPVFLRRGDTHDCGAVALETIAQHYSISTKHQEIRNLVSIDGVGTNLLALLNAADSIGFSSKGMKGSYDALHNIPLPAIAHVTTGGSLDHFVVLHQWNPKTVVISDRNEGILSQSRDEFCSYWTGYLLVVVLR